MRNSALKIKNMSPKEKALRIAKSNANLAKWKKGNDEARSELTRKGFEDIRKSKAGKDIKWTAGGSRKTLIKKH